MVYNCAMTSGPRKRYEANEQSSMHWRQSIIRWSLVVCSCFYFLNHKNRPSIILFRHNKENINIPTVFCLQAEAAEIKSKNPQANVLPVMNFHQDFCFQSLNCSYIILSEDSEAKFNIPFLRNIYLRQRNTWCMFPNLPLKQPNYRYSWAVLTKDVLLYCILSKKIKEKRQYLIHALLNTFVNTTKKKH